VEKRENVLRETRGAFSFFDKVEVEKKTLILTLSVFSSTKKKAPKGENRRCAFSLPLSFTR